MSCASIARWTVLTLLAVLVAACGGGGGAPASTDAVTELTTTGGGSPGTSAPQAVATCDLPAGFADVALALVNDYRSRGADCGSHGAFGPAGSLARNGQLEQAALRHSTDMATHDFFDHTGSDGSTMEERVVAAGYSWSVLAENIAAGHSTVAGVVAAWMGSPDHCANIMEPRLREMALACVRNDATTYKRYWTMDLGTPR